jgi:hypothetical protein
MSLLVPSSSKKEITDMPFHVRKRSAWVSTFQSKTPARFGHLRILYQPLCIDDFVAALLDFFPHPPLRSLPTKWLLGLRMSRTKPSTMSFLVSIVHIPVIQLSCFVSKIYRRWSESVHEPPIYHNPIAILQQTAGLTVAARLSEDPTKSVLVLEGGAANIDIADIRKLRFIYITTSA